MSKEMIEKKNDLITRAEEILEAAKAEQRELTEAEVNEINDIEADVESIKRTLEADEKVRAMGSLKEKIEKEEKKMEERAIKLDSGTIQVREEEYQSFDKWLRSLGTREDVNMTKTDNGAIIPTTIVNWVIRKVYDVCPILERSQKFNVKGKLDVPYYPYDSTVNINVAYADEFEELASTSGTFSTVELTGFLAGCLTKVSRSLMNNTQFDIVGFVVDEMALAIKRFVEHECLIGTPADTTTDPVTPAKVLGLSTLDNKVTAAAEDAVTSDELIELHDSIKDEFQGNAIWIMSSKTRTAIRQLKDNVGRYMLQDDISLPFGVSLLGKPVYVSDNMPDMEAGATAIYYGDMRGLATKFNEDINIEVLRERFATQHAYGVVGWLEFDAKVIDEQQIAKLVMAAGA